MGWTQASTADPDEPTEDGRDDEPVTDPGAHRPVILGARGTPSQNAAGPGQIWIGPEREPTRYTVIEAVGSGGEGITFRATLTPEVGANPIQVALKQHLRPLRAGPNWPHDGTLAQITRQHTILRGLRNPHLVESLDVFLGAITTSVLDHGNPPTAESFDTPFTVMGWVEGEPPGTVLKQRKVSLAERITWIDDVVQAVSVLHSMSRQHGNALIHGDIKPGNCMIDASGRLVLLDLGAATHVASRFAFRGLHTETYAAPEVLADPTAQRGFASDYYSIGATAFSFLTETEPPIASHPDYLSEIRRGLYRSASLRRPLTRRAESGIIALVLQLLDPDPQVRTRSSLTAWATQLRRQSPARTRRRRRAVAAVAGPLTVAVGVVHALHLPPWRQAVDSKHQVIHWDRLATAKPAGGLRTTYAADFRAGVTTGWPIGTGPIATTSADPGGYRVSLRRVPDREVLPAPAPPGRTREILDTTARIDSGQGVLALWCRGASRSTPLRYRFMFSHTGAVGIFQTDAGSSGPSTDVGTGWWYLQGFDPGQDVRLQARCEDADGGVKLTMLVDGRQVLTYRPHGELLGPGYSGVEAYSFGAVTGLLLQVHFRGFRQSSAS